MVKRGQFLDYYKDFKGIPYYLYFLIDPRNDEVCYVGLTKQLFSKRLGQHRNPKITNQASIAKLQRHLKTKGLSLKGEVVAKGSQKFIESLERWSIAYYNFIIDENLLKNHQKGGLDGYGLADESKQKAWKTREHNRKLGKHKNTEGENSNSHILTEVQVLEIYKMIRSLYTNKEIIESLNLKIGVTGINQIRQGKAWKYLWDKEKMIEIPSMNTVKGALNSQEKIQVMTLIKEGKSTKEIQKIYKLQTTDIDRIRNKTLWKMAWNVYDNFYNLN